MNDLIELIRTYIAFNTQEKCDKIEILKHLKKNQDIFNRSNKTAHLTASAWVVNKKRDKVLMIHHNIYNSWAWLGGHADGETNLLTVAIKEVKEESGVTKVNTISDQIFSLEILTVDGHEKNGEYISSHLHLNITFLLEADEKETLIINPKENSGVKWFSLDEAVKASTEPWFQKRIYKKLNEKLKLYK